MFQGFGYGINEVLQYARSIDCKKKLENYRNHQSNLKSSFSMLQSALLCITGSRSHEVEGVAFEDHTVTLAVTGAHNI